ncbi:TIGR01777 family protein [Flaviflexus salsibiostraticola]|uniref:TIGR01777 family protein n=1 Tax=Flaviflexus salsibiostraticola TaxID=1282737 RepID=A0A3Q8WTN3_9ACTO|nr:TIGR01777 family oxidoreductase [Flaviflexus salsibiostraticola]AZN28988.1 TIGR01777 family protein [Flaviflexus salsibiostraticola]
MRVLISGASGFIGTALVDAAREDGMAVVRIVRSKPEPGDIVFDPARGDIDHRELAGADAVVCLNGAGLFSKPWTASYKETLLRSRITSVRTFTDAFERLPEDERPTHFITGSAVGYYGADRGDELLTEASGPGDDFLARVCVAWEEAGERAVDLGIRHSALRTGLVMDGSGGMLGLLKHAYRLGLGAKLGDGSQYMSTISLADHVRATLHVIRNSVDGPVNLTGPHPVTNREWNRLLARHVNRPAFLTVPRFAMKLALGDFAEQAALASQNAYPARLESTGFEFTARTAEEIFAQALPRS